MAGFGTSIAHNLYPAEFAQISRNITSQMNQATQAFANTEMRVELARRRAAVHGDNLRTAGDRDADGHDWGPPMRRQRGDAPPAPHRLEIMAGEGAVFDMRA